MKYSIETLPRMDADIKKKADLYANNTFRGENDFKKPPTVNGVPIGSDNLNGTNYLMVYGVGTPTENAAELQAARLAAIDKSTTVDNIITVLIAPGDYGDTAPEEVVGVEYASLSGKNDVIIGGIGRYGQIIDYIEVTATRNEDDYNSIRELVASLPATYNQRYIVNIPEGRWFECDLHGKKYVEFQGAGIGKTVIYHDGNSNKLTPPDFSYITEANKPLNTVENQYKHCIFTIDDIVARDITFESNYSKYVAHIDDGRLTNGLFENCKFVHLHTSTCVGMGIHSGQKIVFDKCVFNVVPKIASAHFAVNYNGFYIHNIYNQNDPAYVVISNSHFQNCHYMQIDELGSNQTDFIYLENCTSDIQAFIQYKTLKGKWVNPETGLVETDPLKITYCINVIANNCDWVLEVNNNYTNSEPTSRPKLYEYVKSDYAFRATIAGIIKYDLIQGVPGKIDSYAKYNGTREFIGIAQTDSDDNNVVYFAGKGKVVKAAVTGVSDTYVNIGAGNLLEFSPTKTSATVGVTWGLATTGIYFVYLL